MRPVHESIRNALGKEGAWVGMALPGLRSLGSIICRLVSKKMGRFDRRSIAGFFLLLSPYAVGVITRQSASLSNQIPRRFPACDTFIHGLCIPTAYLPIPVGIGYLVLNLTSFMLSASLFLAGFFLVKKRT